ncbi:MAG: DUF3299 domain-containing protein [Bacteroidetes bacterium]|jgi:hypothetical protein|nr:MAG: DUF3299 domain-containing protein [Bacteroidota bacterium]
MKKFLFLILLFGCYASAQAQKTAQIIDWKVLAKVDFIDKYFPEFEAWYLIPKFQEEVKALDQKPIIIKGYIIPMDVEGGEYALSAYPFSACFFCGGAGPESVIKLELAEKTERFDTDDIITFSGTLELNDSDVDNFNYILKNCRPLKK